MDLTGGRPVVPSRSAVRPLGLGESRITGGFWADRQRLIGTATLDHGRQWMDKLGWTGNFVRAAQGAAGGVDRRGREFSDSEVYKLVEAMSWESGRLPSADREREIVELTGMVAAAQAGDGYLHTAFGGPGQAARYSDLSWGHELYCVGHLLQAAVARTRTSGDTDLLGVARRAADHVCAAFGPDGLAAVCGHPEIEVGLAELARLTGEQRYLDQAALFLRRRGHRTLPPHQFGSSYFSDDQPIREASVLRGHAVRALYLTAGAIDVAVETGDDELLGILAAQFDRTLATRTYLTGGMGSRHTDEAFGDDFVLPADRSYAETCAGVAATMVAWRLLLATGDPRYADTIERIIYNVVATSLGDDGRSFFYANTLHQRTPTFAVPDDEEQLGFGGGPRAAWFEVSCCLANLSRLTASLGAYVAGVVDDSLWLYQYAPGEIRTTLHDGRAVGVDVATAYPDDGTIVVTVTEADGGPWTLAVRVPEWAKGATATLNGEPLALDGHLRARHTFRKGDEIRLHLPVGPRFTFPDPRIDAVRDCVAVEAGPLVLCAEADPDGLDLDTVRVRTDRGPAAGDGGVHVAAEIEDPAPDGWPYATDRPGGPRSAADLPLLPYHRWGRRGPVTMRVWLPRA
ncbi:glycoside hydrolase family 127 protein [Hamadaea tsunoensis]|uniref:glycoside hydrolase family 127 protein n=1 Tax=Hamadaea tsunoensis TaxID=53368 RepID=UPI000400A38C|nr:beta-L-arabinofuranosidase domain-containing protein [Hamadaea tsunoensis]